MTPSTETLLLQFHPLAQPVRSRAGWLLACQAPSSEHQLSLLVDFGASDTRPEWDLMPDGPHRILLMLDSPRLVRLQFDLRATPRRTLKFDGMECTIVATHVGSMSTPTGAGRLYELDLTCQER